MRFELDAIEALDGVTESTGSPLHDRRSGRSTKIRSSRGASSTRRRCGSWPQTIAERGVRQPVSVRSHPEREGRWILNFGARRLRAARLVGKTQIPAFVDETADSFDQVIENEQRENLQPLELALFVQRQMRAGLSQAEIARRLGKTRGYLTFLGALIDAPDWLLDLYRSGRCRGMTELHELRGLHDENPQAVSAWLSNRDAISRGDLRELRASLSHPRSKVSDVPTSSVRVAGYQEDLRVGQPPEARLAPHVAPNANRSVERARSLVLWARLEGEEVAIDLDDIPKDEGWIFVRRRGMDASEPVPAGQLQLVRAERLSLEVQTTQQGPE